MRRDKKRRTGCQRSPRGQRAQEEEAPAGSALFPVSGLARPEQELAPCVARQATKPPDPFDAQLASAFVHPAPIFQTDAVDTRVTDGADVTAQKPGDVGVEERRGGVFSFQLAVFGCGGCVMRLYLKGLCGFFRYSRGRPSGGD
jgi:hypothetical protein